MYKGVYIGVNTAGKRAHTGITMQMKKESRFANVVLRHT